MKQSTRDEVMKMIIMNSSSDDEPPEPAPSPTTRRKRPVQNSDNDNEERDNDNDDDELDRLLPLPEDEEGDPTSVAYSLQPPTKKSAPATAGDKDDEDAQAMAAIMSIPSEKTRAKALATFLGDRPAPSVKRPVAAAAAAAASTGAGAGRDVLFPHKQDCDRIANYVYATTVSIVLTGALGTPIPDTIAMFEKDHHIEQTTLFYVRFLKLREQLLAEDVLPTRFGASPRIASLVRAMGSCKLITSNTSKTLHHPGGGDSPVYCAWSGTEITTPSDVRALALVPVKGAWSSFVGGGGGGGDDDAAGAKGGVMFHVHSRYVNIFRCLHTVLFFVDYMNTEIQNTVETTRKTLPPSMFEWNTESEDEWRRMCGLAAAGAATTAAAADGKKKKQQQPLASLIATLQSVLIKCTSVLRKELCHDCFVVITPPAPVAE